MRYSDPIQLGDNTPFAEPIAKLAGKIGYSPSEMTTIRSTRIPPMPVVDAPRKITRSVLAGSIFV